MHFRGKEVVSRSTHVANRSLVTVCAITIISNYYNLSIENIKLLGVHLPPSSIPSITILILISLFINYCLAYYGDFISLKEWNINVESVVRVVRVGGGAVGSGGADRPKYDHLLDSMNNTHEKISEFQKLLSESSAAIRADNFSQLNTTIEEMKEKHENALESIPFLTKDFEEFVKGHAHLRDFSRLFFYGWYGLVPLLLFVIAIWLNV
mgnify:FL=1